MESVRHLSESSFSAGLESSSLPFLSLTELPEPILTFCRLLQMRNLKINLNYSGFSTKIPGRHFCVNCRSEKKKAPFHSKYLKLELKNPYHVGVLQWSGGGGREKVWYFCFAVFVFVL